MALAPRIRGWVIPAVLGVLACGGDATGPSVASIAGTWRLSWNNMTASSGGNTVACNTVVDFAITQTGSTFSGIQQGASVMTCFLNGQFLGSDDFSGESITNGMVTGSSVSFRLGSIAGQHTGTVTGTSMSGSATWTFDPGSGQPVTLTGQWTGARF